MKRISIDLHNMPLIQAQREMQKLLKNCNSSIDEIEVIHGFNSGDRILRYIRTELKHPKIERRYMGLNNGVTYIILKKQKT